MLSIFNEEFEFLVHDSQIFRPIGFQKYAKKMQFSPKVQFIIEANYFHFK